MSSTPLLDAAKKTRAKLRASAESESWFDTETHEIFVYGSIDDAAAKTVLDALKQMRGRRVVVRINSPGGGVDAGCVIFNGLRRHQAGCDCIIDSLAASVASYIFQAGERRTVHENSKLMLHSPWTSLRGNARDFQKEIDVLTAYEKAMLDAYASRSKKTPDEILRLLSEETWYIGQEIVDAGFADEMVGLGRYMKSLSATPNRDAALAKLVCMKRSDASKAKIARAKESIAATLV